MPRNNKNTQTQPKKRTKTNKPKTHKTNKQKQTYVSTPLPAGVRAPENTQKQTKNTQNKQINRNSRIYAASRRCKGTRSHKLERHESRLAPWDGHRLSSGWATCLLFVFVLVFLRRAYTRRYDLFVVICMCRFMFIEACTCVKIWSGFFWESFVDVYACVFLRRAHTRGCDLLW